MKNLCVFACMTMLLACLLGCTGPQEPTEPTEPTAAPEAASPNGLLLALAVLETPEGGKPVPQPAQLGLLANRGDGWTYSSISDSDSNVFHKAMVYTTADGTSKILTAGGKKAMLKLWSGANDAETLWEKDFGGKHSRMRDIEVGDILGDGRNTIAVATHDQGVVALVTPGKKGWEVTELDAQADIIVHEVELGDLNGDGVLEVYATPSEPNKLDGSAQPGAVVRYVPAADEDRVVVADLGHNHAKEILVDDVDGDGTDELYVSVEKVAGGQVEILRYDADTAADGGMVIGRLGDKLCRFLTAGDLDGDGSKEMVAAAHKSGLWLLEPGDDPRAEWKMSSIDRQSSGFEHAAILTDLDGDGADELYVANDAKGEVNRYVLEAGEFVKTTLYSHEGGISGFTWNIMPVPVEMIPAS